MEKIESLNLAEVIIVSMLFVFLFAVSIVLFVFVYQRKLMRQKIDYQKLKLSQERDLLHNSIKVQEMERQKIASDLHDELGAQLSIAKMTLSSLDASQNSLEKNRQLIDDTMNLMNQMVNTVRTISYELLPPSLSQFGLKAATEEFLEKIPDSKLTVSCVVSGNKQLNPDMELHLFRIIQEGVNNAMRYSEASEIRVNIHYNEKEVLTITDNGVGFNPEERVAKGLGISNMKSRAALVSGRLTLESKKGAGTKIGVVLK